MSPEAMDARNDAALRRAEAASLEPPEEEEEDAEEELTWWDVHEDEYMERE